MFAESYSIIDLLLEESFINYCKGTSEKDVNFWEDFIKSNPDKAAIVAAAKENFILLHSTLAAADMEEQAFRLKKAINSSLSIPVIQMPASEKKKTSSSTIKWYKAAAAIFLITTVTYFVIRYTYNSNSHNSNKTYTAANGERKNFQLPDGSFITLNAGSNIKIKEDFGKYSRDVYLSGEAFFDVKHNEKNSFIVHTSAMDIKALGTAFNVKAYQNENITETALIRGLVEVTLKESDNYKMFLYPNQKIKWNNIAGIPEEKPNTQTKKIAPPLAADSLRKTLAITEDGIIKEIAWKSNKLVFDDDQFEEIALLLERWYGAKIIFKDSNIRNYRFTGVFEKEELNTVLDFLQESKNFNYTVVDNEPVTISLSK